MSRSGVLRGIGAAFSDDGRQVLGSDEEQRLLAYAAAGSADARHELTDTYSEIATALALTLRPARITQAEALRIAHDELDRLVGWPPRDVPLLVALTNAVYERMNF